MGGDDQDRIPVDDDDDEPRQGESTPEIVVVDDQAEEDYSIEPDLEPLHPTRDVGEEEE